MKIPYMYGQKLRTQLSEGGRSSMWSPSPWKSCLHRAEGLTPSLVGGESKTDIPSAKQPRTRDRHAEGTGVPNLHLSTPMVCKTQGGLCSIWSLVGTETN